MLLFLLGLVVGSVVAATLSQIYVHRRLSGVCQDLALLRARLRSAVRLAEAGFLEPTSVEAASVLNDLHHLVMVQEPETPREAYRSPTTSGDVEHNVESVPRIFQR